MLLHLFIARCGPKIGLSIIDNKNNDIAVLGKDRKTQSVQLIIQCACVFALKDNMLVSGKLSNILK
jgi:hypothetical protein